MGHGLVREVDDDHEAVDKVGVRAGDEDGSAGVGGGEEELAERRRSVKLRLEGKLSST